MSQQASPAILPKSVLQATARYQSVDAVRGLIMILMAIDHSSAFIARQHASEFWAGSMSAYTSAFPFLTRWITHLCAPGFFFLMGAGIYWFAATRPQTGATRRRVMLRGLVLVLVGQILEPPIILATSVLAPPKVSLNVITAPPPIDGSALYWVLLTLTGLGLVMVACGLLLWLRPWMWLMASAVCVVCTHSLLPADGKPGPLWEGILLIPGISQHVLVLFPVIPWLAVAAAGMYFGYWWRGNPERAASRVGFVGAGLLGLGIVVRMLGGWGNIRLPRDGGWIEFLNNVKYPPSLVFWTMSVGILLLVLALIVRLPEGWKKPLSPLVVFGQTPLFFYLLHFYVLAACAFAFFREPASLEGAWLMWAIVVAALYPLCAWYRRFKMGKPSDSFWRMF